MTTEQILDRLEQQCIAPAATTADPAATSSAKLPRLDLATVHDSVREAHAATRKWAGDILHARTSPYWLTLYGNCGCGKTLLASHAREFLRTIGSRAELRNWPRVLEAIYRKEEGILEQMKTVDVLILDDVGAEYTASAKTSQYSASRLYLLAEARLGKWTLITSNLDYHGMHREIGARFASRIYRHNAVVVDMSKAADYSYQQWLNRNAH